MERKEELTMQAQMERLRFKFDDIFEEQVKLHERCGDIESRIAILEQGLLHHTKVLEGLMILGQNIPELARCLSRLASDIQAVASRQK